MAIVMSGSAHDTHSLRGLPLFAAMGDSSFERLAGSIRIDNLHPGDVLFRQGDPAASVFVVIEGWVKLVRLTSSGDEVVIRLFTRGHSFAETLAVRPRVHSASAEAASECVIARIAAITVGRIAHEKPDVALAIAQASDASLSALMDEIESLKVRSADARVAQFILSLCPVGESSCVFRLPFGKRLIASYLGVKQETLSRSFAKLRSIGIDIGRNEIRVTNTALLEAEANDQHRSAAIRYEIHPTPG